MSFRHIASLIAGCLILAACSDIRVEPPGEYDSDPHARIREKYGTIHGNDGFVLVSTNRKQEEGATGPGLPVNSFLWQGTLQTIDFMPLAQADSAGGVIITDWYSPPETPNERFKLNVYIFGKALRADGVKVTVFRQTNDGAGWTDAPVESQVGTDIENNILTRARDLRVASLAAEND